MKRLANIIFIGKDFEEKKETIENHFQKKRKNWKLIFVGSARKIFSLFTKTNPDIMVFRDSEREKGLTSLLKRIGEKAGDTPLLVLSSSFPDDLRNLNKTSRESLNNRMDYVLQLQKQSDFDILEKKIEEKLEESGRVENKKGILITHGTDTLSWALAYLRYSLKGLKANVAVTGSQIPLEGTFSPSDAIGNLRTAVYLLNKLKPPHLFAVFNNGKDVFSGRLTKFRKWDVEAFEGRLAAKVTHEGLKVLRKDWTLIPYEDQRLEKLYLLKTGGTIESQKSKKGGLAPKGDFVFEYIKSNFKDYFDRIIKYELFSLDSSDLSFEEWEGISRKIEKLGLAICDSKFHKGVKPIFVNPLFSSNDYEELFSLCGDGSILLGYGAGNANTQGKSTRSILNPLRKAVKQGKTVAVTSQVPLELYDAEYESGRKLIEAGGIPCGDLSFSDAQVKLSYLLGHRDNLESLAKDEKIDFDVLLIASFLSGVILTKNQTDELLKRLKKERKGKIAFLRYDPFVSNSFEVGAQLVAERIKAS